MAPTQEDSSLSQDSTMTIMQERSEILYFAYGSNLSTEQMKNRCPFSTPVGLGYLEGWTWLINERGHANIVRGPSSTNAKSGGNNRQSGKHGVYGLLYLLPTGDEEQLDRYEGVPWAYEKRYCDLRMVTDNQGKTVDDPMRALVYVDEKRTGESVPKEEYVLRMELGIEDAVKNWGLDRKYADTVMRRFWRKK